MLYQAELHSEGNKKAYNAIFAFLQEAFEFFLFFRMFAVKKKVFLGAGIVLTAAVVLFVLFAGNEEGEKVPSFVASETRTAPSAAETRTVEEKREVPDTAVKPFFDIVRVEPDGTMVAAGRGVPNDTLTLMDGDAVLARISVDDRGEWVYIPEEPLIVGTHEMWLKNDAVKAREEAEIVVVTVPETQKTDDTIAVLVSSDAEDVKVLQGPEADESAFVGISSANYNGKAFVIRGTMRSGGKVNLYADNVYLGSATSDEEGNWSFKSLRKMENGRTYTIRADKTDENGKVTARSEVPFSVAGGADTSKQRRIRIVKGDNLWTIAKHLYGSGFAYVTIYRANKNQIRDPDLIYPNQVFVLPKKAEK